jgi:gag-polyprotein putative aspartyl protease
VSRRNWFVVALFLVVEPAMSETVQLELEHGVYMLPVRINGQMTIPFILDSGASEIAIPADVFMTLRRTKTVDAGDYIGTGTFVTADGSQHTSERFILREIRVGDLVIRDVIANVVPMQGEPLLGQSFLSRLPSSSMDNANHVLRLDEGEVPGSSRIDPSATPPSIPKNRAASGPRPDAPESSLVRFKRSDCGSIVDSETGLEWYIGPDSDVSWPNASAWAKHLNLCGKRWALPSIGNLKGLFDRHNTAGTGYFTSGKHWPAHVDPIFSAIGGGSWVWANGVMFSGNAPAFNFNQGVEVNISSDRFYGTVRSFAVTSAR